MARRTTSVALGCALALLLTVPARADHGPAYLDETFASYLQIAAVHWGVSAPPCVHATLFDDPNPAVTARAEQPGCRIWLDRDFWPAPPRVRGCVEIAHELGHLLGHGHTPHGLMSEEALGVVPGCSVFRRRPARIRAARRTRARRGCAAGRRCRLVMLVRRGG
jgi:hypothetical protein